MIPSETGLWANISTVSFEATLSCISQAIWNYNRHRTNQRIVLLLPYPRKVLTFAKLYQNRGNNSRDVLERRDTGLDYIFQEISRVESSVWNEESTYTTRLIALVSSGMYIYIYIFELGLANINSVYTMLQRVWSIIKGRNKRSI